MPGEEILQQQGIPATKEVSPQEPAATGTGTETPQKAKPYESKVFASLAKRERELLDLKQQTKKDRETLDTERKEYEDWKAWKSKAKTNPKEYLEKSGLTYEEVTDFYLNDGKPSADTQYKSIKEELDAFKKEQADLRAKEQSDLEQAEQSKLDETIATFKEGINDFLSKNTDKYELINIYEQQEMVYDYISAHYQQELEQQKTNPNHRPRVLDKEEASDAVEAYLEEEQIKRAQKSKKLQTKLGFGQTQDAKSQTTKPGETAMGSKTLSNENSLSSAPSLLSPKTENERIKRALAALERR